MHYDIEKSELIVGASELIRVAISRLYTGTLTDESNLAPEVSADLRISITGEASPKTASFPFETDGFFATCIAEYDGLKDGVLTKIFPISVAPSRLPQGLLRRARGEGFLALRAVAGVDGEIPTLRTVLINTLTGEAETHEESVRREDCFRFAEKVAKSFFRLAEVAVNREAVRRPTMANLKFPFGNIREGQRDFIEEGYKTAKHGGTLFAVAPTGTGKTMAALYPAVRAFGEGHTEKIFYFTPKSTTAVAAENAVKLLAKSGADIRAVTLAAKEKISRFGGDCYGDGKKCPFVSSSGAKERDAALLLIKENVPVVTPDMITKKAEEIGLCPYELSLAYAELCDVVICDYNYLFDLRVYLRRFFSKEGKFCFLIDEAHSLSERAREMYSATLSLEDFRSIASKFQSECKLQLSIKAFSKEFSHTVQPYLRDSLRRDVTGKISGMARIQTFPQKLSVALAELCDTVEKALYEKGDIGIDRKTLRSFHYLLLDFSEKLSYYGDKYTTFLVRDDKNLSLRISCLDPSDIISSRLSLGKSAVFFSATLIPTDYYRSVLGNDRSARILTADSPFPRENAAIAVLETVSTRYNERNGLFSRMADIVRLTVNSHIGNYIVFCPSFLYLERLHEAFLSRMENDETLVIAQKRRMTDAERRDFLAAFCEDPKIPMVAFCVSGGIFSEGIDLAGTRLTGAVVIGVGLPSPSPERDAVEEYYNEKCDAGREYAYIYPGMNRVLQAAGRVIRRETDRGVIVLIDDRFREPVYRKLLPSHWRGLRYINDDIYFCRFLSAFWEE